VKNFLDSFDFSNPDWTNLPEGFEDAELDNLSQREVAQYNAIKTFWELSQPKKPESRSRVWKSPNGYIYLVSWSNASLLRILAVKWVQWLKEIKGNYPTSLKLRGASRNLQDFKGSGSGAIGTARPSGVNSSKILQNPIYSLGWKYIERLEAQLLDCLRSAVANQEEGYARPTTSEYSNFLGYAQASLKEVKGDF
jgi:hypothetical protein